jgi:hypothetical protein
MSSPNVDTLKAMKKPELIKLCIDSGIDEKVCKSSKTLVSDLRRLILASKRYEEELIIETKTPPKKKSVKKKTSPKKPGKKSPPKKSGKKPAVKKSPSKKPAAKKSKRCDEKKGLCAKGRVCDADTGDCVEKPSDMKNLSHLLIDGRVIIGSKKILTDLKKKIGGDIVTPKLKESPKKKVSPKKPSPTKSPSKKSVKVTIAKKPAKKSAKKPAKRCDDEDGSCDPGQLCSAISGKCIKDTKTARKDKSELIVDGRVIIGSKKIIEDLQKKLGGIISDVTPVKKPSPVKKVKKPVKKISPVKDETPSPKKPSPEKKVKKQVKKISPVKDETPSPKKPSPVKKVKKQVKKKPSTPKKPSPEKKKAKSPQKKKKVAFEKRCDSKDDYLKCGPDAVCNADTGKCMNEDDIPEDVERFTIHDDGVERSFVGSSGAIRQLKMILQPEEPARRLSKIAEEEEGEEEVIKLKQSIKKKGKGVKKSPSKLEFQKQEIYETFAKCLESLE